jgi:hypothetical protein
MFKLITAAVTAAGLAGCVGGLETGMPDPDELGPGGAPAGVDLAEAKALYDANVYTIQKTRCGACHMDTGPVGNLTGYVASDPARGYETVTGFQSVVGNFTSAIAGVIVKLDVVGGHPAGAAYQYTEQELAAITEWLDKEVELRSKAPEGSDPGGGGGGSETPAAATNRLMAEWSGCMSIDNFTAANMAEAWGDLATQNNQECENCHVSGAEGFIASEAPEPFFNTISTNKYYMLQYFTVDLTGGVENAAIKINQQSFLGVSDGQDPHRQHPRFDMPENEGMTALTNFYNLTLARQTAGGCDPSRLAE